MTSSHHTHQFGSVTGIPHKRLCLGFVLAVLMDDDARECLFEDTHIASTYQEFLSWAHSSVQEIGPDYPSWEIPHERQEKFLELVTSFNGFLSPDVQLPLFPDSYQ